MSKFDRHANNDDADDNALAQIASSHLHIGSHEITSIDDTKFILPSSPAHASLYTSKPQPRPQQQQSPSSSATNLSSPMDIGVPGFPDFPPIWQGEEGGSHSRRRQNSKDKRQQRRRNQKRIVRHAVNAILPLCKKSTTPPTRILKKEMRKAKRAKRLELKKKRDDKRQRKRDVLEISRGLASLECK